MTKQSTILRAFFLLAAAFLIPEPYSHPFIHVGIAPAKLMPFLDNDGFMRNSAQIIFGRSSANNWLVGVIFLIIFWFIISVILSLTVEKIRTENKKDA